MLGLCGADFPATLDGAANTTGRSSPAPLMMQDPVRDLSDKETDVRTRTYRSLQRLMYEALQAVGHSVEANAAGITLTLPQTGIKVQDERPLRFERLPCIKGFAE
jgi:hypothetical protein